MIADLIGRHLGTIESVRSKVDAIRPMAAGIGDAFPFVIYETSGFTRLGGLNFTSGYYEGTVRLHVCAIEWDCVNDICEAIKASVPDTTCADDAYAVTRIKFDDETDMQVAGEEHETPYYVRVIDLWIRARKI